MNLRSTLLLVTIGLVGILGIVLGIVGCASTPTPVPTVAAPTATPTLPPATAAPTNTPLPPTPTPSPTNTVPPPTNTPIPSSPTPTATNTFVPVTSEPTATPTETTVPLKFAAPVLVKPTTGDKFTVGKDNLVFQWAPVGPLAANECYLLSLRITNLIDNNYSPQNFIAQSTCNDAGQTDPLEFVVNRRAPAPDYEGMIAYATAKTPSGTFRGNWTVTVIQNNGADPNNPDPAQYIPISPPSAEFEFELSE